ncbi:MAG: hypothetical protein EAZ57_02560 [Cytophagales bacterium]|nr:MAG: hypothetical protein EAZ67_03025 [Cytophagales bacterium]TAF61647.1 MAG: hypothetical protein EAZ57_02560 [Cytophagales bacterium]
MKDSSKKWLAAAGIIIVLLSIGLVVTYMYLRQAQMSEKQAWNTNSQKEAELNTLYKKMDSLEQELQKRVDEVASLGGDISSLKNVIAQIRKEKTELKQQSEVQYQRYKNLEVKTSGYEELIQLKDAQIQELKLQNIALASENSNLKQNKDSLSQKIDNLESNNSRLNKKLKSAAVLKAQSLEFFSIADGGKERTGEEFKAKHLDMLRITVVLAENTAIDPGNQTIAYRLVSPEGATLTNAGGGSLNVAGKQISYTDIKDVLYANKSLSVSFVFKDDIFMSKKGIYKVIVFNEQGDLIQKTFLVK